MKGNLGIPSQVQGKVLGRWRKNKKINKKIKKSEGVHSDPAGNWTLSFWQIYKVINSYFLTPIPMYKKIENSNKNVILRDQCVWIVRDGAACTQAMALQVHTSLWRAASCGCHACPAHGGSSTSSLTLGDTRGLGSGTIPSLQWSECSSLPSCSWHKVNSSLDWHRE